MGLIVALHGFFGLPSDWAVKTSQGHSPLDGGELIARNLWADALLCRDSGSSFVSGFERWADLFLASLAQSERPLLIGYSMGGRLAMHAALRAPERFSGAIFVSAHPGLTSAELALERRRSDGAWAARIRSEPWHSLMKDWNSQNVLSTLRSGGDSLSASRLETDFDREALACGMDLWSLGAQRDLRAELAGLKLPTLFVTGSADAKFTDLIARLKLSPVSEVKVVPQAGHRVPWDQPDTFRRLVKEFAAAHV